MYKVFALAKTTFRELAREKVFLVAVILAILLQCLSLLLGALSLAEQQKIMADFGFLAIQLALLGSSLLLGGYLIAKEIEKQTCLLILARPLSRSQFLLGKVLGLIFINSLIQIALSLFLIILLDDFEGAHFAYNFFAIGIGLWLESLVVLTFVVFLSMFVRPIIALSGGIVLFLAGHGIESLKFFADKSDDASLVAISKYADFFTPSFYKINWKSFYFLENGVPNDQVFWAILSMVGWAGIYLLLADLLFRRKDIA